MADDGKGGASDEKVKAAAEGMKKLLDVLAPEPEDTAAPAPSRPIDELYGAISGADVTASAQAAVGAIARYRSAMRWLVAAVAAIGIVLFGSTVFTDGDPLSHWAGWVGLLLSAAGLATILYSATLVFEPEDASLGELKADFQRVGTGWATSRNPRRQALAELKDMLEGEEAEAHLGPGRATIQQLIEGIKAGEAARPDAAKAVAAAQRQLERATKDREAATAHVAALVEAKAALSDPPSSLHTALDARINAATTTAATAVADERAARAALVDTQTVLETTDHQLGMDILHRAVVLDESAIAQLRGTFRLSRLWLLAGALATLVGSLLYLSSLTDDDPDEPVVRSGTLVVAPDTATADEFDDACLERELQVIVPQASYPALGDDVDVIVTDPGECEGTYGIPGGRAEGDITLELGSATKVPLADG